MLMVALLNLNLLSRTNWGTPKGQERLHTTMEAVESCGELLRQMLQSPPQDAVQPVLPEVRTLDTGRTALVVEENATLRQIVATQLAELGYHVLHAPSARPALDILRAQPVDLLFADEAMSDSIDADTLLRSATEIRPALKVISTSDQSCSIKSDVFLPKPYQLVDLRHAVRSITFDKKG
jgi:CheY-like chemotaxis protein